MSLNNFECQLAFVCTGHCIPLYYEANIEMECTEQCNHYGKCTECSWKSSDYCKDCTQKECEDNGR